MSAAWQQYYPQVKLLVGERDCCGGSMQHAPRPASQKVSTKRYSATVLLAAQGNVGRPHRSLLVILATIFAHINAECVGFCCAHDIFGHLHEGSLSQKSGTITSKCRVFEYSAAAFLHDLGHFQRYSHRNSPETPLKEGYLGVALPIKLILEV